MSAGRGRPRVALVAGTLGQGGAEKQLVYTARALRDADVDVRVFALTRGEHYEPALRAAGIDPVWIGQAESPARRTLALVAALRSFHPHVVQSTHFYTNLYASLAAPWSGAIGIGTARSDIVHEVRANGRWGRWLLHTPRALIVNSERAARNAVAAGVPAARVHVVPNVIDVEPFDAVASAEVSELQELAEPIVVGVGTFTRAKRFDRFLHVLARARGRGAMLHGVLVGDGPDRPALEALARELGLLPHHVRFLGRRDDVPAILRHAHVYLLTSDHEGFPNVLLEAMAARLPVVATAAGDTEAIVEPGRAGLVTPPDAVDQLAEHLVTLAADPALRARLGAAGRCRVEAHYALAGLGARVLSVHRRIAETLGHRRALAALPR